MKNLSSSRFALACFGLLSVTSTGAQAQFKCDQPQLRRVDATVCALAAQGDVASVRRYITRTQAIYALEMKDYVRFEGDEPKAKDARAAQVTPQDSVGGVARSSR